MKAITTSKVNRTVNRKSCNAHNFYPPHSKRRKIEQKYSDIITEDLKLGSLVSYVGNKSIPFLRLYKYKEAFAYSFVKDFLVRFDATPKDLIFDPFSGLGTTLFTSMLCGIPSIGVDKLPIAHFVSKVIPMLLELEEKKLQQKWNVMIPRLKNEKPAEVASDVPIMRKAFSKNILLILRKIKSSIEHLSNPYRDILLLLLFSILEECSYTAKDGQFLRLRRDKNIPNPVEAMTRKVAQMEEDICRKDLFFPYIVDASTTRPDVYLGDTRDLSKIKFKRKPTVIITSPPYVNRYDYTRTYSLELYFHFVKNFDELKAIRFGILRSHIESKMQDDEEPSHPIIEEVIDALCQKDLNNPKIPNMIITYFIDMEKTIREWYKVLADGAKVAMVVDNVRFEGELIPVDLVLSDIAKNIGFKIQEVIVARYKGNSSQQMKKYGRIPVRESIVVWEK
jgi:site-specific DNA-methyltransferase (cytosine-N4-specific)